MPPVDAERILIIKPSSLGDIIHALPVLAGLRAALPHAHIAWLAANAFAPLLDGHPLLDEVIPFDRRRFGRMGYHPGAFVAFWRFVAGLRAQRFDLILDLQGLIRSGLISWFSGAHRRIGFADAREGAWLFYGERVSLPPAEIHAVERNLRLLEALGMKVNKPEFPLGLRADELDAASRRLREQGVEPRNFAAVIPGARWKSKLWPAEHLAELLRRMHAADMGPIVLLGAPDERAWANALVAASGAPAVNLVGETTLRELAAMIHFARVVVCHDSGPMHIAAALDRPTIALFGPTNPHRTGPYSAAARVLTNPVECAPCYRRTCPFGHQACLAQLSPDAVIDELGRLTPV
ncbi:MAG: lipopolysaccharide heptosyltransferase I [Phycisphaerae bacterium]